MNKNILSADTALFISRVLLGIIFVVAGWNKVSDMPATIGFFSSMSIPAFLAYIVGYGELIGGVMLILGLWAQMAAIFLSVVMIVAVILTNGAGFAAYSMPLAVLAGLIAVVGAGAGKYQIKS
ncbi:DoxX family protein [Candidatus Nomurabacteria bacterium]|nr:DoxX family protein [Candidatus Nomurabacteria bacterium]